MGEITLHVEQIVNTEELQHYIPLKHVFFFRYVIVNTLHKGNIRIRMMMMIIIIIIIMRHTSCRGTNYFLPTLSTLIFRFA
jgi:hypothetical protein